MISSETQELGLTQVQLGAGVEVEAALNTRAEPNVFSITYKLEGVTEDGLPARGTFSVMRPPPRPTRESSTPVTDPVFVAKIFRTRQLLNKPFVTDEDIWKLERDGHFNNLTVPGSPREGKSHWPLNLGLRTPKTWDSP